MKAGRPKARRKKGHVETNYTYIYDKNHPFSNTEGFIREHRIAMEKWLRQHDPKNENLIEIKDKLYLRKESVVHHINRIKYDNRIENLKVFKRQSKHTSLHNTQRTKTDIQRKVTNTIKHSPPLISLGKSKLKLLRHMFYNKEKRLNIKDYSRKESIPRSTIYSMLESLKELGMVEKKGLGYFTITQQGNNYVDSTIGDTWGVTPSRSQCRSGQLSTHYLRYKLPISDKSNFSKSRIKELNPLKYKSLKWNKDNIYYVYFEDGTIIINPRSVSIRIHEIIAEDTEEAHFKAFNKVIDYMNKISKIGLKTASIELEKGHYARVESHLADFLEKIDKRYFLDLGNGKKFWIDMSPPNEKEDETNDMQVRERIDQFMEDMINSDVLLSDIDKIVKALGFISKIECARLKGELKPLNGITPKEKPNYFG